MLQDKERKKEKRNINFSRVSCFFSKRCKGCSKVKVGTDVGVFPWDVITLLLGRCSQCNQWLESFPSNKYRNFSITYLQVNLGQKHSFLNQLTHSMTTDCSLIYDFSTRKIQVQNKLFTKIVFKA